jgi:thiol-disulfide isomerase/thioredoxin
MNNISSPILKTGGQPTIAQRFSVFFTWQTIAIIAVAFLLCVFAYYTYKGYVNEKTNFHANRENIPEDINANKTATMMLFYVDWCPHCKTAKPEWESLKSDYDGKQINGYSITFVEHNCTNESDEVTNLLNKYSIEGYPTIKLLKDNQVIEYDAKPSRSTMEQFLNTVL